ncbi:MAG: metal-dependent transcriptional regulator [Planctomycetota bacterium]
MPSPTVEDYVRAVYALGLESTDGAASVTRLAATLGVTRGSVSAMVRKLKEAKLAKAEPYGGVRLTAKGRRLALDVVRRHRLIEVFLVEKLGLDWSEVHEEAHRLEHSISAKVLDRLDAYLGHPTSDPHGAPIPDANGKLQQATLTPLAELSKNDRAVVARVSDQSPEFLEFAAAHGLRPGTPIRVTAVDGPARTLTVRAKGRSPVSLSLDAARSIQVEV